MHEKREENQERKKKKERMQEIKKGVHSRAVRASYLLRSDRGRGPEFQFNSNYLFFLKLLNTHGILLK